MKIYWVLGTCAMASVGMADLSLQQALQLGKERNGTIGAAYKSLYAARKRVQQAEALFLPTLTLSSTYQDQRAEDLRQPPGSFARVSTSSGTIHQVGVNWRVLDTGERSIDLRSSKYGLFAQEQDALNSLRQTLFSVYSQYLEVLRSQELRRVSEIEADRAAKTVAQVAAQVKVGDAAEKDVYQPRADELNARVSLLSAENTLSKNRADFKALIGWKPEEDLPSLEKPGVTNEAPPTDELASILKVAQTNRADLKSARFRVDQDKASYDRARLAAGPTLSVDVSGNRQFGVFDGTDRLLTATISYPLFDGGYLRARAQESKYLLEASLLSLKQTERTASAEVESAYREVQLARQRIDASKLAQDAAQINYDKVSTAKALGAAGTDVVAISTAQVSLVTAETNYIQAQYDYLIALARLKLVTGQSVPGEVQ